MFIYPNEYFNKVEEITIEYLKKNKILISIKSNVININFLFSVSDEFFTICKAPI